MKLSGCQTPKAFRNGGAELAQKAANAFIESELVFGAYKDQNSVRKMNQKNNMSVEATDIKPLVQENLIGNLKPGTNNSLLKTFKRQDKTSRKTLSS